MALAKDPARYGGRARASDKGPSTGEILYASNFGENYYDGWRAAHFSSFAPSPPTGLTSYPTHSGKLALQLSTEMRTLTVGAQGGQCSTFRGLSIYTQRRYLSFSAFLTVGVGGYSAAWNEFGMFFDIQKTDNSSRSFARLNMHAIGIPDISEAQIVDNSGTAVDIPGTTHLWPGDNENKQNFGYMRLTWDLQANSGLGGYKEAQIQNQVFDLTALGGGSANHVPQTSADTISEFNGGLNIGLYILRASNTSYPDMYPATLVADSMVLSNHD